MRTAVRKGGTTSLEVSIPLTVYSFLQNKGKEYFQDKTPQDVIREILLREMKEHEFRVRNKESN